MANAPCEMEQLWKPFLRENILDPYPMYKALREHDPVHRARSGEWVITGYEHARTILKDERFKVGNRAEWLDQASTQHLDKWESFSVIVEALKSFIVFKNPPDHTVLRKLIMQAWNNREVDDIVSENIRHLLSRLRLTSFDLVTGLATPLPALTVTRILGLPVEDCEYLEGLSHQMIRSLDLYLTFRQIQKMEKATIEFIDYFERQAAIKRNKPDGKLLSRLIQLNDSTFKLPDAELIANCFFLFIAGEETTAGLIELGLYHLMRHQKLTLEMNDPGLCSAAADELLRFDSPAQIVVRIATEDFTLEGKLIKAGDPVTICLGAANRDPAKFSRPDELILTRSPNHHLAFASGIHRCLGDWLAKREFEILTKTLVNSFQNFTILEEPVWKENLNMRSLQNLQVSFQ